MRREQRHQTLKPNQKRERGFKEEGQNPKELRKVAESFVRDIQHAESLISPEVAEVVGRRKADRALYRTDGEVAEGLKTKKRYRWWDNTDKYRDIAINATIDTNNKRDFSGINANTPFEDWPKHFSGRDLRPVEIMLECSTKALLNPYQIQAAGYIELVRACGNILGNCDGDRLADDYMRLILALAAELPLYPGKGRIDQDGEHGFFTENDEQMVGMEPGSCCGSGFLMAGGFKVLAENRLRCGSMGVLRMPGEEPWDRLKGPQQLKAINVLAAWLRMSRLGVRLSSRQRLESWRLFFDGNYYGVVTRLLGELWIMTEREKREVAHRMTWLFPEKFDSQTPVVVCGIALELLEMAIAKFALLAEVDENFDINNPSFERVSRENFGKEEHSMFLSMLRVYRELAGYSTHSANSVRLVDYFY